jgi:hypothetical protein
MRLGEHGARRLPTDSRFPGFAALAAPVARAFALSRPSGGRFIREAHHDS